MLALENQEGGAVGYLERLAKDEPRAFCALLGRILPTTLAGDPDAPVVTQIRRVIVDPGSSA